ncbi:hypothetical protein C2E23DRAFT_264958 [Lenzites betulinus]|nr:hypothetical protein C2E23DRAFT_264958 [Lenzites betulinus]
MESQDLRDKVSRQSLAKRVAMLSLIWRLCKDSPAMEEQRGAPRGSRFSLSALEPGPCYSFCAPEGIAMSVVPVCSGGQLDTSRLDHPLHRLPHRCDGSFVQVSSRKDTCSPCGTVRSSTRVSVPGRITTVTLVEPFFLFAGGNLPSAAGCPCGRPGDTHEAPAGRAHTVGQARLRRDRFPGACPRWRRAARERLTSRPAPSSAPLVGRSSGPGGPGCRHARNESSNVH